MFLLVACADSQPLPDIDATVEARVTEERDIDATVEARAKAIAKAMIEATVEARAQARAKAMVEAAPIAKPVPPTATPTLVPTTPTPTQVPPTANVKAAPKTVYYSLADIESIGFTQTEETTSTWDYEDLLEAWDGEILVNGTSQYLGVLIFDGPVDEFTKEQFTMLGLILSVRTAIIHNIAIACEAQEVCDYIIEELR